MDEFISHTTTPTEVRKNLMRQITQVESEILDHQAEIDRHKAAIRDLAASRKALQAGIDATTRG